MSVVELKEVSKRFPGTLALDRLDLVVRRGEVHALLGGNGSGKSTLIKALAGVQPADSGVFRIGGRTFDAGDFTPAAAKKEGLHFVHQQPSIFPDLTVGENLAIGSTFVRTAYGRIRWRAERRRAAQILERFGIDADPGQIAGELSPVVRTMVEIARALQDYTEGSGGVLVLDEPTAALPAPDAEHLLAAIRRYADEGQTIVFVSHRLEEVLQVADRATVLRDGRIAGELVGDEIRHDPLVELIAGKALQQASHPPARDSGESRLRVVGLSGGPIRRVDLELGAGEVVGLAGIVGSGRTSLLKMLFGVLPPRADEIVVDGAAVEFSSPGQAMAHGIAYVPEDRTLSAFPDMSLTENVCLADLGHYWRKGRLHHAGERRDTAQLMDSFMIRASSPGVPLASLSGGNQQKAILARWLRRKPRLLLLDEPTQGVDVGARAEIHDLIREAATQGAAVLAASSDFEELTELCDRILVLAHGTVTAELVGPGVDPDSLARVALAPEVAR
ncbi:MAG: sugar ABC transporter ATP-binding protein [Actinobacteria bacterium]|nr:sugar ABC transporter ATP-binding protein [Actinomycetota bacterium]